MRSLGTATRVAPAQLEKVGVQQWRLGIVKKKKKKKSLHSTSKHLGFQTWVGHNLYLSSSLKSNSSVVSSTLQGPLYEEEFIKGIANILPKQLACFYVVYKKTADSGPNLESPLHAKLHPWLHPTLLSRISIHFCSSPSIFTLLHVFSELS